MPVNFSVTLWPANAARLKLRCVYPAAAFRFENVPRVVAFACTVSLSNWVVVVVSAVSMCRKNVKL